MNRKPIYWRWLALVFCRLGVHGPEWFGHGIGVSSPRNYSVGPGHRRCEHCGTQWYAYERATNRPFRVLAWEQVKASSARKAGAK
jgi:hypothetical protein